MANSNWPVIDESVSLDSNAGTSAPYKHWLSVVGRTLHSNKTTRGRQYELQIVQTGEYSMTLDNRDGLLSVLNSSSPYSPLPPYTPYRKRAQWPPTANLLTIDQATGGSTQQPGGTADAAIPNWFTSYGAWWNIAASADAFYGPNVFQSACTATTQTTLLNIDGIPMQPQAPSISTDLTGWHSLQAQIRCTTSTTSPALAVALEFRGLNGQNVSVAQGAPVTLPVNSRAWVPLTVSAQAPVNAIGVTAALVITSPQTCTLETSGWQVEWSKSPSAWSVPGVWY